MFNRCCSFRSSIDYKLIHDPKPIILSNNMDEIIKRLLWYVPNIESYQSEKNELISEKLYDDFSFTYIINKMNMVIDHDVKWIEPNIPFDDNDWEYYEENICLNCQKILITRQKKLSKTNDLLRSLRNCIAHGQFTVVDDYIIGFNSCKNGVKKAVIKIKPLPLLNALDSLTAPKSKELLLAYAFEKAGYNVIKEPVSPASNFRFDLFLEKNDKQYAIEIKDFRGQSYLHLKHLEKFLFHSEGAFPGVERVLIIDTSRVTKEIRVREKEIANFRIIDINQVKELLKEDPIDILTI